MIRSKTRMLVEAGFMLALAWVLSNVKVYEAPFGGSVTAGSMVPLIFFAIRWGMPYGLLVGSIHGLLQLITQPTYFAGLSVTSVILSIFLDYLVAFALLGLAGFSRKSLKGILAGLFLGVTGRFVSHLLSGVVIWKSFAPENMNPWVYSFAYNGSYLGLELVICCVLVVTLFKPLKRFITE
jgi:thiamine transporter